MGDKTGTLATEAAGMGGPGGQGLGGRGMGITMEAQAMEAPGLGSSIGQGQGQGLMMGGSITGGQGLGGSGGHGLGGRGRGGHLMMALATDGHAMGICFGAQTFSQSAGGGQGRTGGDGGRWHSSQSTQPIPGTSLVPGGQGFDGKC